MSRLAAAVSGGVDSAVAAARAIDAGHEVTAVHFALSRPVNSQDAQRIDATSRDAQRVADQLGTAFETWDFTAEFERDVTAYFLAEYARGRTPNPCLRCNETIKFGAVADRAAALGFDGVVTGHYARLRTGSDGTVELHRAADRAKDQSYVLAVLTQARLRRAHFPLGDSLKAEVRQEARDRGIPVADKPDSSDICFIASGDTAGYLLEHLGAHPGRIETEDGTVLGTHPGAFTYTIGQRKGLRIGTPAPDGHPRYVLRLDPVNRTVVVGPHDRLAVTRLTGIEPHWCGQTPTAAFAGTVQLRAHAAEIPARVAIDNGGVQITLDEPAYGIAAGQTAAIYDGTRVIGSATIDAVGD